MFKMMFSFLKRCMPWRLKLWGKSRRDRTLATPRDLRYCYRLLLDREPDARGWATYMESIRHGAMTVSRLVRCFVESPEYRSRVASPFHHSDEPVRVDLEAFSILLADAQSAVGAEIFQRHQYEPHVTRAIASLLRPGMTLVDVGSNVGYFSLLGAGRVGKSGRVIAFDPNARFCELLRRSALLNGFGNIDVRCKALADREGVGRYVEVDGSGMLVPPDAAVSEQATRAVTTSTLDAELGSGPKIDLLKIDVEGAEHRVIAGAEKVLARDGPAIILEVSCDTGEGLADTPLHAQIEGLCSQGYRIHVLTPSGAPLPCERNMEALRRAWKRQASHHIDVMLIKP